MVRNILFVCTGNTCRSPMAAALLRQLLNERGGKLERIRVSSAGLYAHPGAPASPEAVETMRGYGVDLANHLARELAREELAAADLILTMTNAQKNQILKIYPEVKDRTYVLREYISKDRPAGPDQWDVPDPFGQPLAVYQQCAADLEKDLRVLIDMLASAVKGGDADQGKGGEDADCFRRRSCRFSFERGDSQALRDKVMNIKTSVFSPPKRWITLIKRRLWRKRWQERSLIRGFLSVEPELGFRFRPIRSKASVLRCAMMIFSAQMARPITTVIFWRWGPGLSDRGWRFHCRGLPDRRVCGRTSSATG